MACCHHKPKLRYRLPIRQFIISYGPHLIWAEEFNEIYAADMWCNWLRTTDWSISIVVIYCMIIDYWTVSNWADNLRHHLIDNAARWHIVTSCSRSYERMTFVIGLWISLDDFKKIAANIYLTAYSKRISQIFQVRGQTLRCNYQFVR
jgi:hypothetical protein